MSKFLTCRICGNKSKSAQVILECERKGLNSKYTPGQRIVFMHVARDGEHIVLKGTISRVIVEKTAHTFVYRVPYGRRILSVLEKDIQRVSPLRKSAA